MRRSQKSQPPKRSPSGAPYSRPVRGYRARRSLFGAADGGLSLSGPSASSCANPRRMDGLIPLTLTSSQIRCHASSANSEGSHCGAQAVALRTQAYQLKLCRNCTTPPVAHGRRLRRQDSLRGATAMTRTTGVLGATATDPALRRLNVNLFDHSRVYILDGDQSWRGSLAQFFVESQCAWRHPSLGATCRKPRAYCGSSRLRMPFVTD